MAYSKYRRILANCVLRGLRREAIAEKRSQIKLQRQYESITPKTKSILSNPIACIQVMPTCWRVTDRGRHFLVNLLSSGKLGNCSCSTYRQFSTCQHEKAAIVKASDSEYFAFWAGEQEKRNYWRVWNLDESKVSEPYTVTHTGCDCGDYVWRQAKVSGRCKHMDWFHPLPHQESTPPKKKTGSSLEVFPSWPTAQTTVETSINESKLPRGVWLEKTDDWVFNEYLVWCYEISNGKEKKICVGKLYESSSGIQAVPPRGLRHSTFSSTRQAVLFLIRGYGLKLEQIEAAIDLVEF